MSHQLKVIAVLLLASGVSAWSQLQASPRPRLALPHTQWSALSVRQEKAATTAPAPATPETQAKKPSQPKLQVLSAVLDFGHILPKDSPEVASSAAELLAFSPLGECFVGVVTPDPSSALGLVPTNEGKARPSDAPKETAVSIPVAWELRWRRPGGDWTEWTQARPQGSTPGVPPGLWWAIGAQNAPPHCEAELRCRAKFPPLSPPGRYAFSQPVAPAIWAEPVP